MRLILWGAAMMAAYMFVDANVHMSKAAMLSLLAFAYVLTWPITWAVKDLQDKMSQLNAMMASNQSYVDRE